MTSAQVVETSVTNNSSFQNYTHPDDHTIRTTDTPGFKPFTIFYEILLSGSSPGVLYGLPKVHKTGCPFRPIVSTVNAYNYNLASYLVSILQPISTNQYTVKDSFSFADWAKKFKHNNGEMCSLTSPPYLQMCHSRKH